MERLIERLIDFFFVQRVRGKAARNGYDLSRYKGIADTDGPYFLQDRDTGKIVMDRVPLDAVDRWLGDNHLFPRGT